MSTITFDEIATYGSAITVGDERIPGWQGDVAVKWTLDDFRGMIGTEGMIVLTPERAVVTNEAGLLVASSVTAAEVEYLDGLESNAQAQLDAKQDTVTGAASTVTSSDLTADRVVISTSGGKLGASDVTVTALGYIGTLTSDAQAQLAGKQATIIGAATTITAANLSANRALVSSGSGKVAASNVTDTALAEAAGIANASGAGVMVKTGAGTAVTRTLLAPAAGIGVANGSGVSGNITLSLTNDLAGVEGLSGAGLATRTDTDTWATRSVVTTGDGIAIANGTGASGNITITLDDDAAALEALSGTGMPERTGTNTWAMVNATATGKSVLTAANASAARAAIGAIGGTSLLADRAVVTDGSGALTFSLTLSSEVEHLAGVTAPLQTQIDGKQTSDTDLTALAGLSTTGLIARTGSGTAATRTLTGPAAGIGVSNGDGVAGNPTLALANDLSALEGLSGTGIAVRTTTDTWAQRSVAASGDGIAVTNGTGVSGNITLALANDTAAVEALSGTGIPVRTGTDAWTLRAVAASGAGLAVTNGTGVSGNVTIALADDVAAIEALSTSGMPERTGSNTWSMVTATTTGKSVLTAADAAAARSAINAAPAPRTVTTVSANMTLAVADAETMLYVDTASVVITIPTNSTAAIPVGSIIYVLNDSGAASTVTLDGASGVFVNGVGAADVVVAARSDARLYKIATNRWLVGT